MTARPIFNALTVERVLAIATAAAAARSDTDAMIGYADIGKDLGDGQRLYTPHDLAKAKIIGAFDSAETDRLKAMIANLEKVALLELIALLWIGRGDADDFTAARLEAESLSDRGDVDYVLGKSQHLAEYLRDGLAKLGLLPGGGAAA